VSGIRAIASAHAHQEASVIIATTPPETADGLTAEIYAEDVEADGFVFAHTRAMAVNPEAYAAFEALVHTIVPSIGLRIYEMATLGAARGVGSRHCLLAHGRKTLDAGILDADELGLLLRDEAEGVLSPADIAVFRFAYRLSTDSASMTDADTAALRDAGFTDRQIVDITLAASVRNYLSRALQALAVPVDDVPRLDEVTTDRLLAAARSAR
jgi:alkylhydroperoxidase family enzyme